MEYQQCRYKGTINEIPVRNIHGQFYIFLQDVHDQFSGIQSFTCNDKPIPFEHDKDHVRLKPWRIRASIGNVINCHIPMYNDKVAAGIDDDFKQEMLLMHSNVKETLKNTEILKKKADAILCQTFEMAEFTVPRLFIVLPENTPRYNPAHWFHLNYRLHFLCECENDDERHFAFHEGYGIKQPREFFRKYGPYLRKMLIVVKYAISVGSLIVPQLSPIASEISNNLSTQIEQLGEILIEAEKNYNSSIEKTVQYLEGAELRERESFLKKTVQYPEGAELREIESFLKKTDDHRKLGNLYRSVTKDGHVRWVCIQHYEQCYSDRKITDLHEEFQNLGGKVKQDTAVIIGEEASNNFSKILSVLRRGLRVCSVILKNLNIKENDFNELLGYVSQQSAIHSLQLENITVLSLSFIIKKRIIILKLDEILRANDTLNIQYSFTKPLSRFDSKMMDVITKTNSGLIYHVRSRENTSSLALAGTNKTGFTLSINNSDEKKDISYHTAIRNIFLVTPNITKTLLHNGVISESIWTSFHQFLTTNQSLQELTIDCRLTLEQIKDLSLSVSSNRTLKTLHMFNVWERKDELKGFKEIFKILPMNIVLIEFTLTCHTDLLRLGFIAKCFLQNKSLRVVRLPKCRIYESTDVELFESFLQSTSIHTLSLELISTKGKVSLERLAHALDKNQTIEILELKGLDCSAIFHRTNQIPDSEKDVVSSSPTQISTCPSRSKFKQCLDLFSCHNGEHCRHSNEQIILSSAVQTQKDNSKYVSSEPFHALYSHPLLYKHIQEIGQNLKLKDFEVNIGDHVEITDVAFSMKSNSTITRLKIDRRVLIENDIQMLVEALRDNTTIIHLNLSEIKMSITDYRQFFDVLRDNRTLRVLEISQCISHSDRDLFIKEIETLELKNPFLKIVYEN